MNVKIKKFQGALNQNFQLKDFFKEFKGAVHPTNVNLCMYLSNSRLALFHKGSRWCPSLK